MRIFSRLLFAFWNLTHREAKKVKAHISLVRGECVRYSCFLLVQS